MAACLSPAVAARSSVTECLSLNSSVRWTKAGDKQAAIRQVARSWTSVHPWGSGRVSPNFPDHELSDWATAYYGTNYDRLVEIKSRYDPDDVFRFSQSLPVR